MVLTILWPLYEKPNSNLLTRLALLLAKTLQSDFSSSTFWNNPQKYHTTNENFWPVQILNVKVTFWEWLYFTLIYLCCFKVFSINPCCTTNPITPFWSVFSGLRIKKNLVWITEYCLTLKFVSRQISKVTWFVTILVYNDKLNDCKCVIHSSDPTFFVLDEDRRFFEFRLLEFCKI